MYVSARHFVLLICKTYFCIRACLQSVKRIAVGLVNGVRMEEAKDAKLEQREDIYTRREGTLALELLLKDRSHSRAIL